MIIISQQNIGDGKFMLQLGGLSTETKPTDSFVATGSQFIEDDTNALFSFNGSTWDLDKNGQMKDLPVVTTTDNGKILKVDNGVWSIGIDSGSSLPSMTGKSGKVLGVTLDAQEHEQIEWVTPSGGAEKFVVTLTEDDGTWTADKTVAEIVAADAANKIVVAQLNFNGESVSGGAPVEIPLSGAVSVEGASFVSFGGVFNLAGTEKAVSAFGLSQSGETSWQVSVAELGSSNAPLIVTLTADQSTGNLVGDKTYGEVSAAMLNGQAVTCVGEVAGSSIAVQVLSITAAGENQYSAFVVTDSLAECSGASSDYFTITLGN